MKTLYDVLVGIFEAAEKVEYLADTGSVVSYAELMGIELPLPLAESVVDVGKKVQAAIAEGICDSMTWDQAKRDLTCYMNPTSGDVQTVEMWRGDYESMPHEEWFGYKDEEELERNKNLNLHWLDDSGLMEVEYNIETKQWEE